MSQRPTIPIGEVISTPLPKSLIDLTTMTMMTTPISGIPCEGDTYHDTPFAINLTRPSKHQMMLQIAEVVGRRSTCGRKHVGCVITDLELTTILSIGYNGQPRGLDNGCQSLKAGECGCVHAEMNALLKAPYDRGPLVMFCMLSPCETCAKLILNSAVKQVHFAEEYRNPDPIQLLRRAGITVLHHG